MAVRGAVSITKADGSIIIDTQIDTNGFSKGTSNLKSQFKGLAGSIGKLGIAIAAAFSVREIVAFGKEAIQLGSDLQEVQNVVDVTFTTMNEQVNEFAKNAAKAAGLSETMAKRYVGTFGAMAKSFRFTEEEAYNMSTALTQLAGDVASFYNITQDEAYTKLKSVFTGETESLKDLGVVMTQTALDDYALRKGLGKTTDQMSEQEKVALRYQFVLEQLSGASGDFARTSNSWANQTRLLTLQFDQLKATLGQGLINVLTPVVQMLNQMLEKLQAVAEAFKAFTVTVFGDASGGVQSSVESAADSAGDLEQNIEDSVKAAKNLISGFDELNIVDAAESAESITTNVPSYDISAGTGNEDTPATSPEWLDALKSMVESVKVILEPLTEIVDIWEDTFVAIVDAAKSAAPAIGQAFSRLYKKTLKPFATEFVPSIVRVFSETMAPTLKDIIPSAIDLMVLDFDNGVLLIDEACKTLESAFDGVKAVFSDMCGTLRREWEETGDELMQGANEVKESQWDAWWNIYDTIIKPVVASIQATFSRLWDNHLKPLWDDIVAFAFSIGENIMALWTGAIMPLVNWVITVAGPVIKNAIGIIVDAVSVAVGFIADLIGSVLRVINGIVTFIVGVFTLDIKRAFEGIEEIFAGFADAIIATIRAMINAIIFAINAVIGVVYTAVSGLVNTIGKIAGKAGELVGKDWSFSIPAEPPKIPYLAQGAVIPPRAPFLAVLGDQRNGENIEAPLSTIQDAVAQVMEGQTERTVAALYALLSVAERIEQKDLSVQIGDDEIGRANARYTQNRGVQVNTGAFANAY